MQQQAVLLDGIYRREGEDRLRFVSVPAPGTEELKRLVQRIAAPIGRSLERSALITRNFDNAAAFAGHCRHRGASGH